MANSKDSKSADSKNMLGGSGKSEMPIVAKVASGPVDGGSGKKK